jgi:hypothetical protein
MFREWRESRLSKLFCIIHRQYQELQTRGVSLTVKMFPLTAELKPFATKSTMLEPSALNAEFVGPNTVKGPALQKHERERVQIDENLPVSSSRC